MNKKRNKQLQKLIRAEKGQQLIQEGKEHLVRLGLISDKEAKRIPDEEVIRLFRGMHHIHLSGGNSICVDCWRRFAESGLEWDVWLEEGRKKYKETGQCDCGCCDELSGFHKWN